MDAFTWGPRDRVRLDEQGLVRAVIHGEALVLHAPTPAHAASQYLRQRADKFGLDPSECPASPVLIDNTFSAALGPEWRVAKLALLPQGVTVNLTRSRYGLASTRGGIAVRMRPDTPEGEYHVLGASRRARRSVGPSPTQAQVDDALASPLAFALGSFPPCPGIGLHPLGHGLRLAPDTLGCWAPALRSQHAVEAILRDVAGQSTDPQAPDEVVLLLTCQVTGPGGRPLGIYRLGVRVRDQRLSGLEPLGAGATARAFAWDPVCMTGDVSLGIRSSDAALNPAKELVTPFAVDPPVLGEWSLKGTRVKAVQTGYDAPPTSTTGDFDFTARTSDFGYVSAYYHVNHCLERLEEIGLGVAGLFVHQTAANGNWPLPVTLASTAALAETQPKPSGPNTLGANQIVFDFLDPGALNPGTLWSAADGHLAWHEVAGHVTLLNQLDTAYLDFAHSFGDGIASVFAHALSGYTSGLTYPWTGGHLPPDGISALPRHHDLVPGTGSASALDAGWGSPDQARVGIYDPYLGEQSMSSTLHRLYRSLGGDSSSSARRLEAARVTTWLAVGSIAGLAGLNVPAHAEAFEEGMELQDATPWPALGLAPGAYHKPVRWAFEKQGCFRAGGGTYGYHLPGSPPDTDVYVQDGRSGEYTYSSSWWWKAKVWNRHAADGQTAHQKPKGGVTNYLYARVGNRGVGAVAYKVHTVGWYAPLLAGGTFPTDFTPIPGSSPVTTLSSGQEKYLRIAWTPPSSNDFALMVAARHADDGDNTPSFSGPNTIAVRRLVPNDNNLGFRVPWIVGLMAVAPNRFKFSAPAEFRLSLGAGGTFKQLDMTFAVRPANAGTFSAKLARAIGLVPLSVPITPSLTHVRVDPQPFPAAGWMVNEFWVGVQFFADGTPIGGSMGLVRP